MYNLSPPPIPTPLKRGHKRKRTTHLTRLICLKIRKYSSTLALFLVTPSTPHQPLVKLSPSHQPSHPSLLASQHSHHHYSPTNNLSRHNINSPTPLASFNVKFQAIGLDSRFSSNSSHRSLRNAAIKQSPSFSGT